MKSIGSYALLFKNSMQKGTWKNYGFDNLYEQTNLIFSILLFIMEQSLKDEICTMDDIGSFIDVINMAYLKKPLSYAQCKELGDFVVNVILCDEGRAMYFQGFDYDLGDYKQIHISFIANKIVYAGGDVKRTSYYLTDDGYNLLLSTLEVEENMKLTIQEMIFKLHLEKATYDKAVDDIKNIFNLLRIQLQRMQEAMRRIRQNALQFSVKEYSQILGDNLSTIENTKKKFLGYREHVKNLVESLEKRDIHVEKLDNKEAGNLKNLKIIEGYLNRALDEHQKILSSHFDLKALYTKELETLSEMSLIKRFSIRNDLYDKILQNAEKLDNLDLFLRPLFNREADKTYNINKAFEYQKVIRAKDIEESERLEDFDDEAWVNEQNEKLKERLRIYKESLLCILEYVFQYKGISLCHLMEVITEADKKRLLPNVEIFREVMVELLKNRIFDINSLEKEKQEHFLENSKGFQVNLSILEIMEEHKELSQIKTLEVRRSNDDKIITLSNVPNEAGELKRIRCTNVEFLIG